jgi:hypothetical protein
MDTKLDVNDPLSVAAVLGPRLDARQGEYLKLQQYFEGTQPLSFVAADVRRMTENRLESLVINWASLVVNTVAERLVPTGFTVPKKKAVTAQVNQIWQNNDMDVQVAQGIIAKLIYGRSYAIVWGDSKGKAQISIESPQSMIAYRDPATRQWTAAFKRWTDEDGKAYGIVYTANEITWIRSKTNNAQTADIYGIQTQSYDLSAIPANGWEITERIVNPLGELPVVVIPNRPMLDKPEGMSELSDILPMADAVNKMATDMMVTSEFYAQPRRWATGVEIEETPVLDDEGNPTGDVELKDNYDDKGKGRWHLFEDTNARVGQFDEAELNNFVDGIDMLSKYIAAVKKIPAHYFDPAKSGLASAEAVRAAEAPLVVLAKRDMVVTGGALESIARLALKVESGDVATPAEMRMETIWADPENLTQAQKVDAATKRAAINVPTEQLWRDAGYSEQQIEDMKDMQDMEAGRSATSEGDNNE